MYFLFLKLKYNYANSSLQTSFFKNEYLFLLVGLDVGGFCVTLLFNFELQKSIFLLCLFSRQGFLV